MLCSQEWPYMTARDLPARGPFAASSPDFVTVTFFWPLFLQVPSDFPQVLNFVLQGFNLRERGGRETRGGGGWVRRGGLWPLPTFVGAEGVPWLYLK